MKTQVVVGGGPLGRGTAGALVERGCVVRLVSRRGAEVAVHLVRASVLGERFFQALVDGKAASYYGRRDVPHSYTYLHDFCRTMAEVADISPESTWMVPSSPPLDMAALEGQLLEAAGLPSSTGIRLLGRGMLPIGGWFVSDAREMVAMLYEFESPFVIDASRTETELGLRPTELATGLARTIEWYRDARPAG